MPSGNAWFWGVHMAGRVLFRPVLEGDEVPKLAISRKVFDDFLKAQAPKCFLPDANGLTFWDREKGVKFQDFADSIYGVLTTNQPLNIGKEITDEMGIGFTRLVQAINTKFTIDIVAFKKDTVPETDDNDRVVYKDGQPVYAEAWIFKLNLAPYTVPPGSGVPPYATINEAYRRFNSSAAGYVEPQASATASPLDSIGLDKKEPIKLEPITITAKKIEPQESVKGAAEMKFVWNHTNPNDGENKSADGVSNIDEIKTYFKELTTYLVRWRMNKSAEASIRKVADSLNKTYIDMLKGGLYASIFYGAESSHEYPTTDYQSKIIDSKAFYDNFRPKFREEMWALFTKYGETADLSAKRKEAYVNILMKECGVKSKADAEQILVNSLQVFKNVAAAAGNRLKPFLPALSQNPELSKLMEVKDISKKLVFDVLDGEKNACQFLNSWPRIAWTGTGKGVEAYNRDISEMLETIALNKKAFDYMQSKGWIITNPDANASWHYAWNSDKMDGPNGIRIFISDYAGSRSLKSKTLKTKEGPSKSQDQRDIAGNAMLDVLKVHRQGFAGIKAPVRAMLYVSVATGEANAASTENLGYAYGDPKLEDYNAEKGITFAVRPVLQAIKKDGTQGGAVSDQYGKMKVQLGAVTCDDRKMVEGVDYAVAADDVLENGMVKNRVFIIKPLPGKELAEGVWVAEVKATASGADLKALEAVGAMRFKIAQETKRYLSIRPPSVEYLGDTRAGDAQEFSVKPGIVTANGKPMAIYERRTGLPAAESVKPLLPDQQNIMIGGSSQNNYTDGTPSSRLYVPIGVQMVMISSVYERNDKKGTENLYILPAKKAKTAEESDVNRLVKVQIIDDPSLIPPAFASRAKGIRAIVIPKSEAVALAGHTAPDVDKALTVKGQDGTEYIFLGTIPSKGSITKADDGKYYPIVDLVAVSAPSQAPWLGYFGDFVSRRTTGLDANGAFQSRDLDEVAKEIASGKGASLVVHEPNDVLQLIPVRKVAEGKIRDLNDVTYMVKYRIVDWDEKDPIFKQVKAELGGKMTESR